MAYIFFPLAVLGAGKSGLTIGYRLVNADGTEAQAFTTTNVVETNVPGNYVVSGGISLPDGFRGRIEWGESGAKYAEEEINPEVTENADVKVSTRSSHDDPDPTGLVARLSLLASGGAGELTPARAGNLDNLDAAVSSRQPSGPVDLNADQSGVTIGTVNTVGDKTGYALSAAGVDAILDEVVEGSYTLRQLLRGLASVLMGKVSGGGTTTITFRDLTDAKDRVVATVDANGNRTSLTLDLT